MGGGGGGGKPKARALYAYQVGAAPRLVPSADCSRCRHVSCCAQGSTAEELTFNEGDIVDVLQEDPGGWWECGIQGRRGWAPANYLQKM